MTNTIAIENMDELIEAISESGPAALDDLTDVDISTPTDGQVLTYDDTNDKWVNSDPAGGYTATTLFTGGTSETTTFNLSDDITNYDDIIIYFHHTDDQDNYDDQKTFKSSFLHSRTNSYILGASNDLWYYYFTVIDDETFAFGKSNNWHITDIIGIKY